MNPLSDIFFAVAEVQYLSQEKEVHCSSKMFTNEPNSGKVTEHIFTCSGAPLLDRCQFPSESM